MDDLLIYNAKVISMREETEIFHAFSIKKGKFHNFWSESPKNPELLARKLIDAQNQTIIPGLTDSHAHFMIAAAFREFGIPISVLQNGKLTPPTIQGVLDKAMKFAQKKDSDQPLLFSNVVAAALKEGRLPLREEIDAVFPNRIVLFMTTDGHSMAASKPALVAMDINPQDHSGLLTEDMPEFKFGKVTEIMQKWLSFRSLLRGVQEMVNDALNQGIVAINCMDGMTGKVEGDNTLLFLKYFSKVLPLRLRLYPQVRNIQSLTPFFKRMHSPRVGGCAAWEMDGSVGAHTAAFYDSYKDQPNNLGVILFPREKLMEKVRFAHQNGIQVTSHAIGTRAIDELLSVYEEVLKGANDKENRFRFRIDHFEFPTQEAVRKAIEVLHLLVVPQPGFSWMDANYPGMDTYGKYLPDHIVQMQIPLKHIAQKGGIICGSSDAPIQPLEPFLQMHGMINFPITTQQLSPYQALRTYTYNGAFATFEEQNRGTIEPGKLADFIMLDQDPLHIDPTKFAEIKVNRTYIGGQWIKPVKYTPVLFLLKSLVKKSKKI